MPSRTRQPKPAAEATAPAEKRGRGRPPKAFEELSESGKAKRLERQQRANPEPTRPTVLKSVPPAPPAPAPEPQPELPDDDLPPFAIREEIDVTEFMRRAMLGLINPTARQMIAARALMAMQPKPPAAPAGQGAEPGKKEQRAGAAQVVAGGSKYNPEPPPSRLRVA